MKCALICDEGFEEVVARQLKSYKIEIIEINPTCILFNAENHEIVAEICYTFQSAIKILTNIEQFNAVPDLEKTFRDIKVKNLEKEIANFKKGELKITCVRKGAHNFRSIDLASKISHNYFKDFIKTYKNHQIEVLAYIKDKKGYIGIDFTGRTLSKRDYKIFNNAGTLRGSIAYNLLLIAEAKREEVILDPFMGSGTIIIEAALAFSNLSPFYFTKEKFLFTKFLEKDWKSWFERQDNKRNNEGINIYGYDSQLKMLKYTQKNSKIADINKQIKMTMCAIDWLDTKLEEKTIDKIITNPPYLTEHTSKTKILKIYKEIFNQSDYILKENGTITILTNDNSEESIKDSAKFYKYSCYNEMRVFEGQQEMVLLQFKKEE